MVEHGEGKASVATRCTSGSLILNVLPLKV